MRVHRVESSLLSPLCTSPLASVPSFLALRLSFNTASAFSCILRFSCSTRRQLLYHKTSLLVATWFGCCSMLLLGYLNLLPTPCHCC